MTEEKKEEPKKEKSEQEINFEKMRKKHERELAEAAQEQQRLRKELDELKQSMQKPAQPEPEDTYDEPYVDDKRLNKKLNQFGEETRKQTQSEIQKAVQEAIKEERRNQWLDKHSDFNEILEHADQFAEENPDMAQEILTHPSQFERQKLAYFAMKKLGYGKKKEEPNDVQQKINQNRSGIYYAPTGVAPGSYQGQGNFSKAGQKDAYQKMKELQAQLRL